MRSLVFHHSHATHDEFTLLSFLAFGAVLFTIVTSAVYFYANSL